jgi:hypothetical protein
VGRNKYVYVCAYTILGDHLLDSWEITFFRTVLENIVIPGEQGQFAQQEIQTVIEYVETVDNQGNVKNHFIAVKLGNV